MRGHGGLQLTNPQYEILDDEDARDDSYRPHRAGLREKRPGSVTPKMQRRLMARRCSGCRPTSRPLPERCGLG